MSLLSSVTGYFERFLHPEPGPPPATPHPESVVETAQALGESLGALENLARSLDAHFPTEGGIAAAKVDREAEEQQAMEMCWRRMREAILRAHEQLQTGLDDRELSVLDQGMEALEPHLYDCVGADITKRIVSCSLHRIFHEVGKLSWNSMIQRTASAGLSWPPPSGMSPSARAEEIAAAAERNRAGEGEAFLTRTPTQVRQLMLGVVKVWRAVYPSEDSGLWQETVWQGVAAGLRIYLFEQAVDLVQRETSLPSAIQQLLERELESARDLLSRGLSSSSELNAVLSSTDRICRQQVPDLVWGLIEARVAPLLERPIEV